MSSKSESGLVEKRRFEAEATEFGNGAHIVVPKDWEGMLVRVKVVGSWVPPLFQGVAEGETVFVETTDEGKLNGEVVELEHNLGDEKRMESQFVLDTGKEFYRVSIEREVGEDGWEGAYELEKTVSGDDWPDEIDEIVSLEGGAIWAPCGEVSGVAVMESASE